MERAIWTLLLGLILLTSLPATVGAGVTEDATTSVERTVQVAPSPLEDARVGLETARCSGTAPPVYLCTTGLHMTSRSLSFELGATNYQGVLENRIEWNLGLSALVFRCEVNGATADCTLSGSIPDPGTLVLHTCRSLDGDSGLPGGQGSWRCGFTT